MFLLHKELKENLLNLGDFKLSKVLLMPDSDIPWVILVPRIPQIEEWHQLTMEDQKQLLEEMNLVSLTLTSLFKPDKINIGALGNKVPQFHLHIICRYKNDKSWPGPIWGASLSHNQEIIDQRIQILRSHLFAGKFTKN